MSTAIQDEKSTTSDDVKDTMAGTEDGPWTVYQLPECRFDTAFLLTKKASDEYEAYKTGLRERFARTRRRVHLAMVVLAVATIICLGWSFMTGHIVLLFPVSCLCLFGVSCLMNYSSFLSDVSTYSEQSDFLIDLVHQGRGVVFNVPQRVLMYLGHNHDTDPSVYLSGVENLLMDNKVHEPYSKNLLAYLLQNRREETLAFLNIAGQTRNLKTLETVADGLDSLRNDIYEEEERIAEEKLAGGPDLSDEARKLAKQILNKNI